MPTPLLHLGSSLRTRPPAETFALATRLMPTLGISRVTDVTRMDRLGLPVFISVRPRGQALCVHAGKGLRPSEAQVGALMEGIEFAVAEPQRSAPPEEVLRINELEAVWAGEIRMLDLAPRMGPAPPSERRVEVVRCEDLAGGRAMPLPAELIFVPFDSAHGDALFGWTTNGLASGNTVAEATLHALLEVLERDALAMNTVSDESCWLPPQELPEPCRSLAASWRELGVSLAVRHVPNDAGLPCFTALLHEGEWAHVDLAAGYGLHLDPHIALARAVCEAAQSRLSHIHGGRDDVTCFYAKWAGEAPPPPDARETLAYRLAFDTQRSTRWQALPAAPFTGKRIEDVLAGLVQRLQELGFPKVLRHRFALELGGLHVVKVVVPGCQEIDTPWRRMGRRLYERVLAHA